MELMSWIKWVFRSSCIYKDICKVFYHGINHRLSSSCRSQAPVAAVFAGSPQLLGAVKLCSGSAVTSLPLYSDINLLKRTEDVSFH